MRRSVLAAVLLAASVSYGVAAPITIFDATLTADGAATPPLGITASLVGPAGFGGGVLPGGEIALATGAGTLAISVQDLGLVEDVFEIVLDGVSLGLSSPVAINGPVNSAGSFSATIGAGFHSLGVWDPVLTYLGVASPFGGTVPLASRPGEFHPQALLEPCLNLSVHTAPDVRPLTCKCRTALPCPQSSSRYRLALSRG